MTRAEASSQQTAPRVGEITIENESIRIGIDCSTGSITSLFNKRSGLEAIDSGKIDGIPWRLQIADIDDALFERRPTLRGAVTGKTEMVLHYLKEVVGGVWTSDFDDVTVRIDDGYEPTGAAVDLVWRRVDDIEVAARIELASGSPDAVFTVAVRNPTSSSILAIEYPIIDAIRPLGDDSADNRLAHSVDGGFLFEDPHRLFKDQAIIESWKQRRIIATTSPSGHPDEGRGHGGLFRVRGYPNGFEGAPMQFWAFYKEAVGGFYFASHDPLSTEKMFHFYATDGRDVLTSSIVHYAWDWRPGDVDLGYPILIGALNDGTWYEAAERYREWATGTGLGHPDWCSRGTLRDRVADGSASKWLVEGVGFNTFGIPISLDMSPWFDGFHAITGKPVMHIVGHDWEGGAELISSGKRARMQDLLAANNVSPSLHVLADVLGITADEENVAHLRDMLIRFRQNLWDSFHVEPMEYLPPKFHPANVASFDATGDHLVPFLWRDFIGYGHDVESYGCHAPITPFTNAFMCPTTDYWRRWHFRTDKAMIDSGVDSIYYDVSASCATPTLCMNRRHDHPIGFGRQMIDAYASVFRDSKAAFNDGDRYFPIGTEVIIENLLDVVDYAQCRAGAGVQATMEGEEFVEWQKDGRARKIPLWSYVYHEFGPVLLDGWAKLSSRFGDIFYEIASRVALEGGLFQLNYEFSPLERLPGMSGPSYQLVYTNQVYEDDEPMDADPAKLEFLREIAEARTGFGKDYLAYGRMIPNATVTSPVPEIDLDWDHFNSVHRLRLESGVYRTRSIVQVGWEGDEGKRGYFFVNLLPDRDLSVEFDPSREEPFRADVLTSTGRVDLGRFEPGALVSANLPPRRVVLVETTAI